MLGACLEGLRDIKLGFRAALWIMSLLRSAPLRGVDFGVINKPLFGAAVMRTHKLPSEALAA